MSETPPGRKRRALRRVLAGLAVIVVVLAAGVVLARRPLAHWAVERALTSAGLSPVAFDVRDVGFDGIDLQRVSIGADQWLVADSASVSYSMAELWRGQVGVIELRGARWAVAVQNGRVDWGYPTRDAGGPVRLPFPPRQVELSGAAIEVRTNEGVTEIPVNARLTRAVGGFDATGEIGGLGRTATLTATARADDEALMVTLDARVQRTMEAAAAGPVPSPSMVAVKIVRSQSDASLRIAGKGTLVAFSERFGETLVGAAHADVDAEVALQADWTITGASGSLRGTGIAIGPAKVDTLVLKAIQAGQNAFKLTGAASGDAWRAPAAGGTLRWRAQGGATVLSLAIHADEPLDLGAEDSAVAGTLGLLQGDFEVAFGGPGVTATGRLTAGEGTFQLGDVNVTSAEVAAAVDYPRALDITSLSAVVGDGGTIRAAPFTLDLATRAAETRVSVHNLSLAEWLPLLTGDRAHGEGRVSGEIDIAAAYGPGGPTLTQLGGTLQADPPRGTIQVSDSDAVAELMERRDPRFATDPTMAGVRDRVVDALRDFAFSTLRVTLSRRGDRTAALAYLSGFGRHGEDPQGINLTLDLQADDAALGLVTRMASKARLRKETGEALERFFGDSGKKP